MATIIHPTLVDARAVAKAIQDWLSARYFETKALEAGGSYIIKARNASAVRAILGADRALEIQVGQADGRTLVDVRQGSWTTNVVSNLAWLVVTAGMNLAISGWSVVIQKELESYIRSVLAELSGAHEVDLATGAPLPPKISGSLRPDGLTRGVARYYHDGVQFYHDHITSENRVPPIASEKPPADISFCCPHCGQPIVVEAGGSGLLVNCPGCQAEMTVPGSPEEDTASG